jgi:hypothetical protein
MNKQTDSEAAPKNLYLDRRVIGGAESYVEQRKKFRRSYSLSQLVQDLLVRELKKQGIQLPPEFFVK